MFRTTTAWLGALCLAVVALPPHSAQALPTPDAPASTTSSPSPSPVAPAAVATGGVGRVAPATRTFVPAPPLVVNALSCTGGCARTGWVAGFGSYRITGRANGINAGTALEVLVEVNGVVRSRTTTAVQPDFSFATTVPVSHAGQALVRVRSAADAAMASSPMVRVNALTITMDPASLSASTVAGTRVKGKVNTGLASREVRLSVWRWVAAERRSRWSLHTVARTDASGAFAAHLNVDNGAVRSQKWRAETNYTNAPTAWFASGFTESKIARMDPVVTPATAAMVPYTYRAGCPVGPSQLSRIEMNHFGFDGRVRRGHLIVRTTDVDRFTRVFTTAFQNHFPLREMRDPSPYRTDDASMAKDNSYGFFCRQVNGNPYRVSPHSYGRSVDINPVENPYRKPNGVWSPPAGASYVDRSNRRPGMLFADSPMTRAFQANGFTWLSGFDWQHFQVG